MTEYAAVLKKRFGMKPIRICDFFYVVASEIYCICTQGSFVICPNGFNRTQPERYEGFLIWKLYCDNPDVTLKDQMAEIRNRDQTGPTPIRALPTTRDDEAA